MYDKQNGSKIVNLIIGIDIKTDDGEEIKIGFASTKSVNPRTAYIFLLPKVVGAYTCMYAQSSPFDWVSVTQ